MMKSQTRRRYISPRRRQQADATRQSIIDAARRLLAKRGYAAVTMAAIAAEAAVAVPTVYAIFGSKPGILKALIDRAIFNLDYEELVAHAFAVAEPAERLRHAAKIARQIYQIERAELDFLRKAGIADPERVAIDKERESQRFATQAAMTRSLNAMGALRPGLELATAHDILWTLTGRDLFHRLVIDRRWSAVRYEAWLGDLLVKELLGPPAVKKSK